MPTKYQLEPHTHLSLAAVLSCISAVASPLVSLSGHGAWGLALGIIAIFLGLIGFIGSAAAGVRGGLVSLVAIGFGVVDLVLAILAIVGKLIVWAVFR